MTEFIIYDPKESPHYATTLGPDRSLWYRSLEKALVYTLTITEVQSLLVTNSMYSYPLEFFKADGL